MNQLADDLDETAYWLIETREALENLNSIELPGLNGDQIADYRSAIARLDAAIFNGFHIIHKLNMRRYTRSEPPRVFTLNDL